MKSTEYKSQDDSPRSDELQNAQNNAEIENEVDGFDFKKLKYVETDSPFSIKQSVINFPFLFFQPENVIQVWHIHWTVYEALC